MARRCVSWIAVLICLSACASEQQKGEDRQKENRWIVQECRTMLHFAKTPDDSLKALMTYPGGTSWAGKVYAPCARFVDVTRPVPGERNRE